MGGVVYMAAQHTNKYARQADTMRTDNETCTAKTEKNKHSSGDIDIKAQGVGW
jgi:hypothetical protein